MQLGRSDDGAAGVLEAGVAPPPGARISEQGAARTGELIGRDAGGHDGRQNGRRHGDRDTRERIPPTE